MQQQAAGEGAARQKLARLRATLESVRAEKALLEGQLTHAEAKVAELRDRLEHREVGEGEGSGALHGPLVSLLVPLRPVSPLVRLPHGCRPRCARPKAGASSWKRIMLQGSSSIPRAATHSADAKRMRVQICRLGVKPSRNS
jgi:hypothetical protein